MSMALLASGMLYMLGGDNGQDFAPVVWILPVMFVVMAVVFWYAEGDDYGVESNVGGVGL